MSYNPYNPYNPYTPPEPEWGWRESLLVAGFILAGFCLLMLMIHLT